jgi:TRAP transporter 4TM/12TM fusion protein
MGNEDNHKIVMDDINIQQNTNIEKVFSEGLGALNFAQRLYMLFAIGLSGFSLYTAAFGLLESWKHRMIHLMLILVLVFLSQMVKDFKKEKLIRAASMVLMLVLWAALLVYVAIDYEQIILRMGIPNMYDKIFGTILIILVMVASYRKMGLAITSLGGLFMVYALFGNIFPGDLYHRGMSYGRFIDFLFNQTIGILGVPIKVAAEYVIMFIIFGAFLTKSGAGEFFIRLSFALTGRYWGGPAKAAVVASALMATINGSGVGNAVATGSITIPLMKKVGYKPHFAAAVEAAASNGGMIMPPVMASVAFLIAEFTKTPYSQIMLHGLIPASLYFFAVILMVHFEAKKTDLSPLPEDQIPDLKVVLASGWYFFVPILILGYMLFKGFSPMMAASMGIMIMVILSYVKKETRMGIKEILAALEEGSTNTIAVSVACAVAGIIVGVITGTGLGVKFSSMILSLAGDSMFMVLFLTMISSIIMGMGMTAAAVYVIVSALTVPALITMGVPMMPAHFFVYYYGISSAITPPVALAAYGAAGIAGADNNKTALTAMRLAIVTFVIPFAFVYNPELLAIGSIPDVLVTVVFAMVGVLALSAGIAKWLLQSMSQLERLLLIAVSVMLFVDILFLNLLGVTVFVAIWFRQKNKMAATAEQVA